jgi:trans-aconitate methyltransferase
MSPTNISDRLRDIARMPAMHLESWVSRWLPYRPERPSRHPERHYRRLAQIDQLARYSLIAGYCDHFQRGGAILDVGCGQGLLADRLGPQRYSRYLGIDSSREAICHASRTRDDRTRFVQADAAVYVPEGRFDVIVFNESLYCFADPSACLLRYAGSLADRGVFVVSMYGVSKNERIWNLIAREHRVEDEVRTSHGFGRHWVVKVLTPVAAGGVCAP